MRKQSILSTINNISFTLVVVVVVVVVCSFLECKVKRTRIVKVADEGDHKALTLFCVGVAVAVAVAASVNTKVR